MWSIVPSGGERCDFCNKSPVQRTYLCHNFLLHGVPVFRSEQGTWATCQNRAELVHAESWAALTERAVECYVKRQRVSRFDVSPVRQQFAALVREFSGHVISEQ